AGGDLRRRVGGDRVGDRDVPAGLERAAGREPRDREPDRRGGARRRGGLATRRRDLHVRRGRAGVRVDLRGARARRRDRTVPRDALGGGIVIDMPRPGAARSFWLQEALTHDPGEPTPPLESNRIADVCIVGGGFAGLWTAVRLTERAPGMRIVILEQDIVGGG